MPQLLNLSRAARLVGVSRGVLQQKIRDDELPTFEGKIKVTDLLRLYPLTRLEDNTMLEKVAHIKATASPKSMQEREFGNLPSHEVLGGRITALGRELVESKLRANLYAELLHEAGEKLRAAQNLPDSALRGEIGRLIEWLAKRLEVDLPEAKRQLLVRDAFMRVMAAHVKVIPSGHEFLVEGANSLLDAALAAGLTINYGCTSGNCGMCKARVVSGEVWKTRTHDYRLSEAEQRMGYVLMCSNTAVTDLVLEAGEALRAGDLPFQEIPAWCERVEYPAPDIAVLTVHTPREQSLRFMAGQYVRLSLENGAQTACYLASCPCDGHTLSFHLAHGEDAFNQAVFAGLAAQTPVVVSGPYGNFSLREGGNPVLLLAYGEGFGPIKSLVEQAIAMDSISAFHLYWLVPPEGTHYLYNLCRSWHDALDNFQYTLLRPASFAEALGQVIAEHPGLDEYEVYVAGPSAFTGEAGDLLRQHGLPGIQLHTGALPPG
jgi:CDP-4-dehydro-6-deoxyglucose reductase